MCGVMLAQSMSLVSQHLTLLTFNADLLLPGIYNMPSMG